MVEMNESNQNENQDGSQGENQGDQKPDYRESFTPETKTALEKFDSVEKLADGYISLEKDASRLRNEKGLVVPDENASDEDISAFHKAIGRPDTPEGYEIVKPDLPEGIPYSEERMSKFSEIAHKAGLSKSGFQAIVNAYNEDVKDQFNAVAKDAKDFQDKSTAEMKKDWGPDFKNNLAQADAAIGRIFGEEFKKVLVDTGLNNHPVVIKGMFKASQAIGEHSLALGGGRSGGGELTQGKLQEMTNDPRYWDPSRRNDDYVKKVEQYSKDFTEQNKLGA